MLFGIFLVVVFGAVALVLFRSYARYKLNYWNRRGVEQLPNADLVFGHIKDGVLFRTAPGWHMGVLHNSTINKDAPFVGFYIFHKPCLLLRDPNIIKDVMIRRFDNFTDRHYAGTQQMDSLGMTNLFGLKNPTWKYLRSKITPTLSGNKLRQMLPLLMQTAKTMMNYLKEQTNKSNEQAVIDAQELSYKYTTDATANIALGITVDSFHDPNEYTKFGNDCSSISYTCKGLGLILSLILRNGDNLVNLTGTYISGFESSSNSVSFTLMELAENPEYQDKAREDIERAIKEHGLTYSGFNDMKYLDQCIYESARLHPPVPTVDRLTKEDYEIPGTGVTIKKGTPIFVSLYGMHLDPQFFKQPEIYDPSRFAGGQTVSDAFLPFGLGPRMCPGKQLGMLHAKVVLAMILREYSVTQNPESELVLDSRFMFTAAAESISLRFNKITK
ncbi:cytochrome P450 6l1-like [Copidosoma floridanum]|uniref:cytochrome P450 6l1-like n=1 Tax=Copidosoma floridanum TaxID=29053 RepID=UPI000C6FB658|nr:cytochrome P450 6l1-like [Copidosoma floridanum]